MVASVLCRHIRVWRCHTQGLEEGLFIWPYPAIAMDSRHGPVLHGVVNPGSGEERFKLCLAVLGQKRQFIPESTIDQIHEPADEALAPIDMIHSLIEDFVRVGIHEEARLVSRASLHNRQSGTFVPFHPSVRPISPSHARMTSALRPQFPHFLVWIYRCRCLFRGERHNQPLAVPGMILSYQEQVINDDNPP